MKKNSLVVSSVLLASSIAISSVSWAVSPLNTVNDGRIVKGGTYYNTPGNTTSFINSKSGGLWLKAGTTLRGLEANTNGTLTNNGGTVHLYAPDNVVRVDGTLDVNAIRNSQGAYLGNGGKVFIDSAYLFQNGNIFANGVNGGLVQMNVAGMTLGAGAQIQAKGSTGAGGTVAINSAGPVDLKRTSVIDTSGKVLGTLDSNLINIEAGLVNNEGTLRAHGVSSRGGAIRLVASGQSLYQEIKDSLQAATINPPGDTSAPTISVSERTTLLQRAKGLINTHDGQVFLARDTSSSTPSFISNLSANGTGGTIDSRNDYTQSSAPRAGDGGNITLLGMNGIQNLGNIRANGAGGASGSSPVNGGNGGTISFLSETGIANSKGRLEANGGSGRASTGTATGGKGGDGGLISFGYNGTMTNTGGMYADGAMGVNGTNPGRGGNGGLMVFSGNNNPTGNGSLDVIGRPGGNNNLNLGGKSGTIVSPNPTSLGQTQVYFQQGYVNGQLVRNRATQQTQPVELLTHAENLIMLTKNGGNFDVAGDVFGRMNQARIRSVTDPTGALGLARNEVIFKNTPDSSYVYRNLILGSSRDNLGLSMLHPYFVDGGNNLAVLILPSPLSNGLGLSTLNTLSVVNNGAFSNPAYYFDAAESTDIAFNLLHLGQNDVAGGRVSVLSKGIDSSDGLTTNGTFSGGSIHLGSLGSIISGSENVLLMSTSTNGSLHSGSVILKASENIENPARFGVDNRIAASGGLMGGTVRLIAKGNLLNGPGSGTSEFNSGNPTISAGGVAQGGIVKATIGKSIQIRGTVESNGTEGRAGYINLHADNSIYLSPVNVFNSAPIGTVEANGAVQGGQIVLTAGDHISGNEGRPVDLPQNYFPGIDPTHFPALGVRALTPPITTVRTEVNLNRSESLFNFGLVNALGGSNGKNGKIYLGANEQVGFRFDTFNHVQPTSKQALANSDRNQVFQNAFLPTQANGGKVYIVAGLALTNKVGQTRNAVDATNEAASAKTAPNVNPNQNGQGALLPNDFFLPNP